MRLLPFILTGLITVPLQLASAEPASHLPHDAVPPLANGYPAPQTIFAPPPQVKRVAIVGAGASGAAAAFFLRRAARVAEQRAGLDFGQLLGEIVVYEREEWVGGRSTVVYVNDDNTTRPIELGASIFVDANENLVKASALFNLTVIDPDFGERGVGIWDGDKFLFTTTASKSRWSGWWDTLAAIRRYGPLSPYRQRKAVALLLSKFAKLYTPQWLAERGPVASVEDFAQTVDLGNDLTTNTGQQWATETVGVGERWWSEIMEASTRVNYASDMDQIHALGAAVSLASDGARAIEGGNYRIFEAMLKDAKADVRLGFEVTDIAVNDGARFTVSAQNKSESFDQVFFAAPWHQSTVSQEIEKNFSQPIPYHRYVKLHVTLLTTTQRTPNPSYFQQTPNFDMPTTILTTSFTSKRQQTPLTIFQSLTYHQETSPDSGEWVVKIFSLEPIDDYTLTVIFGAKPTWVYRKVWRSYPYLHPISAYPPVEPIKGFHYLASLEPWVSTMETQTLSAREAVARVARKWWGLGLGECDDDSSWDLSCN